jgi:hypothetical protein
VCHASSAEGFGQIGGNAVVIAKQYTSEQGCLGIGDELIDGRLGSVFEGKNGMIKGAALPLAQYRDLGQIHQAMNTLSGQVIFVAEVFKFRRGFYLAL